MSVFVITAARRDDKGEVSEVLMAAAGLRPNGDIDHAQPVSTPVIEVVNHMQRGDRVHLLFDKLGPAVKTKVLPGGMETIEDAVVAHPGVALADLPTF
jgi:hypothetical protein